MYECIEKDWKLFKTKIVNWQEAYIGKKIDEYKELLNSNLVASTKFWKLDKKIKEDKHNPGVLIEGIRRSHLFDDIISLIDYKVITIDDLADFSDELKDAVNYLLKIR